ncbi:FAD-dependent monooxygenase, partial [Escherichia coli]|uniref:FAD-dependent monooxygenase n=1 Tax=Escherichia coli TaxID=562 RepID=UPI0011D6C1CD
PRWSKGRVGLTGDAAWCATPLAGIGTTLAITGAFVLAQELSRNRDVRAGFAAYERAMRPMVEQSRGVPKIAPKLANPKTRPGIRHPHGALRIASTRFVRRVFGTLFSRPPRAHDLSAYDGPTT